MKNLTDYVNEAFSQALEKNGAFWAFGNKQFEEKRAQGVKYADMGAGLICPVENCRTLREEMKDITRRGVDMDMSEHSKDEIILRELINQEAFYTCDIEDTVEALSPYPIAREQILAVYRKERQKQSV